MQSLIYDFRAVQYLWLAPSRTGGIAEYGQQRSSLFKTNRKLGKVQDRGKNMQAHTQKGNAKNAVAKLIFPI